MAKYCRAIGPSCRAKEPPPPEASSCLDTDFTPVTDRAMKSFLQVVVLLYNRVVYLDDRIQPFALVGPPVVQLEQICHQGGSTKTTSGPYKTHMWSL